MSEFTESRAKVCARERLAGEVGIQRGAEGCSEHAGIYIIMLKYRL
jgi:hypothetical protein